MIPATCILQALVGAAVLLFALTVLLRTRKTRAFFIWLPASFLVRVPLAVIASALGIWILAAIEIPFFSFFASAAIALMAVGLSLAMTFRGAGNYWPFPAAILIATTAIAVMQPLGLRVLNLPTADNLPYSPAGSAQVLKTYDEGVWLESVRAAADGTLYLAANRGQNYETGDNSRAQGQVIARAPDGKERTVFTLPMGSTVGVITVAPDGTLFFTGNGSMLGIWRISPKGEAVLIAKLPQGSWPNGLDFGPDGMLYSTDSAQGLIWRIDPQTGRTEQAIEDRILAARPFVALAPGANGIHFKDRDMIVTVSDSAQVVRFHLGSDGHFEAPTVSAKGIPGDDFAIGKDGSLFVTTHPYNTVVRVTPDGQRSVVGDIRQNVVGPTDAVFGRGADDRDTLYVVTDGGAFAGGSKARGQLIALKPFAAP